MTGTQAIITQFLDFKDNAVSVWQFNLRKLYRHSLSLRIAFAIKLFRLVSYSVPHQSGAGLTPEREQGF
jgi:hypothetical protein